jgi:hypothetical protein
MTPGGDVLWEFNMTKTSLPRYLPSLPPPDFVDPVIEAYKKDIDRTLIRENLKLTVAQRFEKYRRFREYARELRDAGQKARMQK